MSIVDGRLIKRKHIGLYIIAMVKDCADEVDPRFDVVHVTSQIAHDRYGTVVLQTRQNFVSQLHNMLAGLPSSGFMLFNLHIDVEAKPSPVEVARKIIQDHLDKTTNVAKGIDPWSPGEALIASRWYASAGANRGSITPEEALGLDDDAADDENFALNA